MLPVIPLRRTATRFVALLPFALLATACSDSDVAPDDPSTTDSTANDNGGSNGDAPSGSGGSGNGGSAGAFVRGTGGSNGGTSSASAGSNGNSTANGNGGSGGTAGSSADIDPTVAVGPRAVELGSASNYAILAQSAISNVPTSAITGALGLSPAAASYVTGFALTRAGVMWTSPEVSGGVFAADNDPTTPAVLTTAVGDMLIAYDDAAGREAPTALELAGGAIGGLTLAPGLYKWTSSVTIPSDVTLAGAAGAVWIFQISGDLVLSPDQVMTLSGGAQPENIVWQVAGRVDLQGGSHAEGIMLSKTAINMGAGASINGRLLAQTAVTIASSTVVAP